MSYFFVFLTIALTVYGQLVIKWQVVGAGAFPEALPDRLEFLFRLMLNPWVISAFVAALLASIAWMAAMTKLPLSHAYPLTSLTFVLVLVLSPVFFHEPLSTLKIVGMALVVLGIAIGSQG